MSSFPRWDSTPATPAAAGLFLLGALACAAPTDHAPGDGAVFEIVCASSAHAEPLTGRALVFLSKTEPEPRSTRNPARLDPVLAVDFVDVPAGAPIRLDGSNSLCFPTAPAGLESGLYWAQAVLDLETSEPWPGLARGAPCSEATRVLLGGGRATHLQLVCDRTVPETLPDETRYVRLVEVESKGLTAFHGRPITLRALVHLPQAWFDEPERRFPMAMVISGFGASLQDFHSVEWPAVPIDDEPFVFVYPDPSCSNGHSAFLNSDNNGPWGDAFVNELLPVVEQGFRCIDDREARLVAGHSSGGWAALSLITHYPATFGAAWATSPDPVDFRDFMGVDLYADDANFLFDGDGRPRPFCKLGDWVVNTTREHAQREHVLRGGILGYFEALFSRRDAQGRPMQLFDRTSGAIDPTVVADWRSHDLSLYLREHWRELGPLLDGRIVLTIGDGDNFLLQGSVEHLRRELDDLGARVEVVTLSGDHFSQLDGVRSAEHARRFVRRFRAGLESGD